MKHKILFALATLLMLGLVSCNKDEQENGNGGGSYSAQLVGTWQITSATFNGQDLTGDWNNLKLTFNENGNGILDNGDSTEHNTFVWAVSGNNVNVTTTGGRRSMVMNFTITSMTDRQCTFSGTEIEVNGTTYQGDIVITMVKISGGNNPGGNGGDTVNNSYSSLLPGTWELDGLTYNGQNLSSQIPNNLLLIFYAGGTGLMSDNGETENNDFSWVINGDNITVTVHGGQSFSFTIISMNTQECSFSGDYLNIADIVLTGDIKLHMTKVIGGGGSNPGSDTTYHPTDPIADTTGGNNYSTMILGTWQISHMTLDSANVTSQLGTVKLSFYSNGTGLISNNGVTENNDYGWSLNGNVLTITPRGGSFNYTILYMSSSSCTVSGTMAPGIYQTGAVQFSMNKLN